jgi:hypothetical protein
MRQRFLVKLQSLIVVTLLVALPASLQAQVPSREMALLPVAIFHEPVEGAHGSRWIAEFRVFNSGHQTIVLNYLRHLCLNISPCIMGELVDPNQVNVSEGGNIEGIVVTADEPSAIVNYDRSASSSLHFQLRIRDLSRDSEDFGVELPVVRESELLTGSVHLPDVPVRAPFRSMVRVYDMHHAATSARVRIFDQASGTPVAERTVTLLPGRRIGESIYRPRSMRRFP